MQKRDESADPHFDEHTPCVRCGHDLRGLVHLGACPECGTPIVETLRETIRRRSASPSERWGTPLAATLAVAATLTALWRFDGEPPLRLVVLDMVATALAVAFGVRIGAIVRPTAGRVVAAGAASGAVMTAIGFGSSREELDAVLLGLAATLGLTAWLVGADSAAIRRLWLPTLAIRTFVLVVGGVYLR